MPMRDDEFRSHPIHETAEQLYDLLEHMPLHKDMSSDDKEVQEALGRAARRLQTLLELADPALIHSKHLQNLNQHATNALNELKQFSDNGSRGHLTNAGQHFENVVAMFPHIGKRLDEVGEQDLQQVAEGLRRRGEAAVSSAEKQVAEISKTFEAVQTELSQARTSLSELSSQVLEQKKRADDIINQIQANAQQRADARSAQFNEALSGFNKEHEELLKTSKKELDSVSSLLNSEAEKTHDQLTEKANGIMKELGEILEKARGLFNLIGETAVTGRFSKAAREDKKAADRYRWAAVFFLLATAAFVTWLVLRYADQGWGAFIYRFPTVVVLLFPAWYAMRESNKHRRAAFKNRRIELELAALDPFISDLDPEQQKALKTKLTEKYFGQDDPDDGEDRSLISIPQKEIFQLLREAIKGK